MRLTSFYARKIHNIFDFNIEFNNDINILIGQNGTGKTTVLKMIIAMFAKDYIYISKVGFEFIKLEFVDDNEKNYV